MKHVLAIVVKVHQRELILEAGVLVDARYDFVVFIDGVAERQASKFEAESEEVGNIVGILGVHVDWVGFQSAEIVVSDCLSVGQVVEPVFVHNTLKVVLLDHFRDFLCFDQLTHRYPSISSLGGGRGNLLRIRREYRKSVHLFVEVASGGVHLILAIRVDVLVQPVLQSEVDWRAADVLRFIHQINPESTEKFVGFSSLPKLEFVSNGRELTQNSCR